MIAIFSFAAALLVAIGILYVIIVVMMPTVCLYAGNKAAAATWLRRYFRHDMALYDPFDLVYLYIATGRADEVQAMYRKYSRKGNIGSEYFVDVWVAVHQGEWQAASRALEELRKYTIMNDVDIDKLAAAVAHKSAKEVDDIYLIDMNGRAAVQPSFFRLAWVVLACGLIIGLVWAALVYFVLNDTALLGLSASHLQGDTL